MQAYKVITKKQIEIFEKEIGKIPEIIDWWYISMHKTLSEDFIREFQDKVSWCDISIYQKLSIKFREEFKNKIDFKAFYKYNRKSIRKTCKLIKS